MRVVSASCLVTCHFINLQVDMFHLENALPTKSWMDSCTKNKKVWSLLFIFTLVV